VSEHLRIEQHETVRVLTVDRPEPKNALHGPLRTALRAAIGADNDDDRVAAVVLTAVDPVLSAGVDFKRLQRGPDETGGVFEPRSDRRVGFERPRARRAGAGLIFTINGSSNHDT
jgi:enoyl-CoA hydratase